MGVSILCQSAIKARSFRAGMVTAPKGAPAADVEDLGLAMLRHARAVGEAEDVDDWLARRIVLFARKFPKERIRRLCDHQEDFVPPWGAEADDLGVQFTEQALYEVDGTCPHCGRRG